jgi:transcriptional regulator with GAF, ATPase, and Fis domain
MTTPLPPKPTSSQVLARLLELSSALARPRPLEDSLKLTADALLSAVPADHASVRMLDHNRDSLVAVVRSITGQDVASLPFKRGEGISGWVADNAESAVVDDVSADPRFSPYECGAFGCRALVAVPMFAAGEVVGVMCATNAEPGLFSDRDERIVRLVANAATPLIDRSRLKRLRMVPRLTHALTSPLRLRMAAELIEAGDDGLTLEEAVLRSGRHRQDVEACLQPMVRWGVVEHDGEHYRLRAAMPPELRKIIDDTVAQSSEQLVREKHIRHHLLGGMIGVDPKMQMVFEIVQQVARIDVPVLITGETGTGKELVARSIHDTSPRRTAFFGAVNCATLTETLFESQVFGHMRGAFTGAVQDYVGLVERCNKGTLFLDEVGDLSLTNQVKLLRLLQEGAFTRLGSTDVRRSDFRVISATNRDLQAMVQAGSFREDLYYRLAVFPIRIPSLRERIGDLKYLVEGILSIQAQRFRMEEPPVITPEALQQLERYHWPGNVRELENVIARAVVMAGGGAVGAEHLPEVELLSDRPRDSIGPTPDDTGQVIPLRTLEDVEREHIVSVLRAQKGNIKATANVLGISRTTLYKKIRDYRIDAPI